MTLLERARAWMELLRLPNLLTVPGFPIAGFLMAGGKAADYRVLIALVLSALFLYVCGLILNDLVDFSRDSVERPRRPLPSGRISKSAAKVACVVTGVAGLVLALLAGVPAFFTAIMILLSVLVYDFFVKDVPFIGATFMGGCRALTLTLGFVAAGGSFLDPAMILCAAIVLLHVLAFSSIALNEMEREPGWTRWLPLIVMGAGLAFYLPSLSLVGFPAYIAAYLPAIGAVFFSAWLGAKVGIVGVKGIPAVVGGHIRTILLIQAAFCGGNGLVGITASVALLAGFAIFGLIVKSFYSS